MSTAEYAEIADEKLIKLLRAGDDNIMDFILEKYKPVVKKKARAMFLVGGDTDDLIQEGMIGLYKAIRDYDLEQEVSFARFADVCISRQIYTAINTSNRKKHGPLNSYISFYSDDYSDVRNDNYNPENILIDRENAFSLEEQLNSSLSRMERQVLKLYIEGKGYMEIAGILEKSPKSVDNAIQRIKTKAIKIIKKMENS